MSNFKIFQLNAPIAHPETILLPSIKVFAGGEINVKLPSMSVWCTEVRVEAMLYNSEDVMTLVMLTDALRVRGVEKIHLTMPYIPYARQDRVCNEGEAFSIKAFARIINSLNFATVVVFDAHSDVSAALIDRCINVPRSEIMTRNGALTAFMATSPSLFLVSPDAGASKKSLDIAKAFGSEVFDGVVYAEKVRDVQTGNIIKTTVSVPCDDDGDCLIEGADLLICDDICDGGRTFIELAKALVLYAPNSMSLYVTHGIFSYGKDILYEHFDNVWSETEFGYTLNETTNKYTRG